MIMFKTYKIVLGVTAQEQTSPTATLQCRMIACGPAILFQDTLSHVSPQVLSFGRISFLSLLLKGHTNPASNFLEAE